PPSVFNGLPFGHSSHLSEPEFSEFTGFSEFKNLPAPTCYLFLSEPRFSGFKDLPDFNIQPQNGKKL
ncbi:MAG: hypothetical protein FWF67_03230, partial [Fibromonadales bacterium]|nr:hypothetical protein [Fibromonadales bacterium]